VGDYLSKLFAEVFGYQDDAVTTDDDSEEEQAAPQRRGISIFK